ncbi:MAG: hypothetical protein JWQ89_4305 [Devosia sp.]|nr:hypothetical protein [Devosia sp.]
MSVSSEASMAGGWDTLKQVRREFQKIIRFSSICEGWTRQTEFSAPTDLVNWHDNVVLLGISEVDLQLVCSAWMTAAHRVGVTAKAPDVKEIYDLPGLLGYISKRLPIPEDEERREEMKEFFSRRRLLGYSGGSFRKRYKPRTPAGGRPRIENDDEVIELPYRVTVRRAARILGVSVGTASTRLSRVRKYFDYMIKNTYFDDAGHRRVRLI